MKEKKSQTEYCNELKEIVLKYITNQEQKEDLINFLDSRIELINKKKELGRLYAEEQRDIADALTSVIYDCLSIAPVTIEDIVDLLDDPDITPHKVIPKVDELYKRGLIDKKFMRINRRRKTVYFLKPEENGEDE